MTHLLLQPLLLLLDLLLQGLAELLHILVVLSHTSAGDSKAQGGGQTLLRWVQVPGTPHCPWDLQAAAGSTQRGSSSQGHVQLCESGTFAIPCMTVEGAQPQTSALSETSAPATDGHAESTQFLPPWVRLHSWGEQGAPSLAPSFLSHPSPLPRGTHLLRVTSKASFLLLASWMRCLILARKSSRLPRSLGSSCRSFTQSCQISCLQREGFFVVSISPTLPKDRPAMGSHAA